MKIIIIFLSVFSLPAIAVSDFYVNLTKIHIEGSNNDSVTVNANDDASLLKSIVVNTQFGKFNIPEIYLKKIKYPDLRSVEFLYNPGGLQIIGDERHEWGLYYVFKMYFDDESTEDRFIEDEDRPQLKIIFEDGEIRDLYIARVVDCKGGEVKCWEPTFLLKNEPNKKSQKDK